MSKVAIVTDSVACIPEALLKKLNIKFAPYYIHWGAETFRDLISMHCETFYQRLTRSSEDYPKTANPSPGDYLEIYEKLVLEEGAEEIASIHITSKGSGAYQAALNAKEIILQKIPTLKIEVIDTLNVSLCQGWMVIEAAREALDGASLEAVVGRVKSIIPRAQMLQTADTLKYLYRGGRIGKAKHLVGSLLNIKPIISMKDGIIVSFGQARTRQRVYRMMVDKIEETIGSSGKFKIAYVHAAAAEEAEKLKELVEKRLNPAESLIAELSPALGVHTGPGTVGLCYYPVSER
jgi:DegV family protein with EDD domain